MDRAKSTTESLNLNRNMQEEVPLDTEEGPSKPHADISDSQRAQLVQEAEEMKPLLDSFDKEFYNLATEYFYVLSAKWLRGWKRYTSYNEINENNQPDERWFGQVRPEKINHDIIEHYPKAVKYPDEDDYRNIFLKDKIQEKKDYELVTEAAWNYLANRYESISVKRYVYTWINGMRYVEVALKLIKLVPINNTFLREMDHKKVQEFKVCLVQASSETTLADFKSDLSKIANLKANQHLYGTSSPYIGPFEVTEKTLRLWKLDPALSLKTFYLKVKEICENSKTYDYQIEFKGQFIDKESKETKLEETRITADDYVFLEAREPNKGWNFYGDGAPMLAKCEFCNKYDELSFFCSCKKVFYCSENCKMSDKRFHEARCPKAGEEESKIEELPQDAKESLPGSHTTISSSQRSKLIQEVQEMKPLLDSIDQKFKDPKNGFFYIISAKWLKEWKRYTSYNEIRENSHPDERWFGQVPRGKINEDIIEECPKVVKYPDENDYRNVFLKNEIQEKKDYELVNEAAWNYLANRYESIPVKRYVYTDVNGMRYVEVALKRIKLIPINNNFLKEMDHKKVQEFKVCLVQASSETTLADFKSDLAKIAKLKANQHLYGTSSSYIGPFEVTEETLRLWKLDSAVSLKDFYQKVQETIQNSRTYDYQIEFQGEFIDKQREAKLGGIGITDGNYVILEARESVKSWNFYGGGAPMLAKCEFCNKYDELSFFCSCNKVAYCSEDCKMKDQRFHQSRCPKA